MSVKSTVLLIQTHGQLAVMNALAAHPSGIPESEVLKIREHVSTDVQKLISRGLVSQCRLAQHQIPEDVVKRFGPFDTANVIMVTLTPAGRRLVEHVSYATADVGVLSRQKVFEVLRSEVHFPPPGVDIPRGSVPKALINRAWQDAHQVHSQWVEDVIMRLG